MAMGDGGGRKSDIISLHEMKEAQHGGRGGEGRGKEAWKEIMELFGWTHATDFAERGLFQAYPP